MRQATDVLRAALPICFLLFSIGAFAQATMTTTGNWEDTGNWTAGNVGDALGENVTINNSVSPTIHGGANYTIGNIVFNQDNVVTVDASTLNVGSSGNARNFTTNLNPNITVTSGGVIEIWGDFIANNNVVFNIAGMVRIHGNMQFSGAGTQVTVNGSGTLYVLGNMTGGGNVNFTVNGAVDVSGSVNVGAGSNLTGSGTFHVGGTCSGSPFCSSGILPVDLLFFKSKATSTQVDLAWSTASEYDLDYFILERSLDGKVFNMIGKIAAMGNSNSERVYTFTDEKPVIGTSYFRLNEFTRGGQKKVLSTIKSSYDGGKSVTMYPNPAVKDESLSLSLNFKTSEPHEVSIFDIRGVLMGKATMNGEETTLPLSLSSGVYIVRVASRDFSSVQRLVVQ